MAYLALDPVSAAVYTTLNVAGLTALLSGGISDSPAPGAQALPFVWYEVAETRDVRGFGTGGLPEVELRVHVFSAYEGLKQAQTILAKVIELLRDQVLTISGYRHAGHVFYDDTTLLTDEVINGVACHELVARFRIYAEEA